MLRWPLQAIQFVISDPTPNKEKIHDAHHCIWVLVLVTCIIFFFKEDTNVWDWTQSIWGFVALYMIIRAMLLGNCTRLWLEDFLVADCISEAWCRSHCSLFAMFFVFLCNQLLYVEVLFHNCKTSMSPYRLGTNKRQKYTPALSLWGTSHVINHANET